MMPTLLSLTRQKAGVMALFKYLAFGKWNTSQKTPHSRARKKEEKTGKDEPILTIDILAPVGQYVLDSLSDRKAVEAAKNHLGHMEGAMAFERGIERCFEGIEMRAAWLERDRADLEKWLKENGFYTLAEGRTRRVFRREVRRMRCF